MRTDRSSYKRLLKLLAGVSAISLTTATALFAAEQLPEFSRPTLTPASQAAAFGSSFVPNALASYYTYIPLSNADAVALGFPSACGYDPKPALPLAQSQLLHPLTGVLIHQATAADRASTADCYVISLRHFPQPTSLEFLKFVLPSTAARLAAGPLGNFDPSFNLFPGNGLVNDLGQPFVNQADWSTFTAPANLANMTQAQGYGSGGNNWQPHGANGPTIRGNAPWAFQDTPFNFLFGAAPTGDQRVTATEGTGIWHFPSPTIKGTVGRPVYVQWLNDLTNKVLEGFDPSIDCGHTPDFCYPYNREVVHVHGAHVTPESDGLATAWYTPNYAMFGEGNFTMANYPWGVVDGTNANPLKGKYIYKYPMDTEASTIWYHTHAVGITHTNTNAGQAGFFPVTDANEKAKIGTILPDPAYEHGFAFQERHFDTTAQMRMPDIARYDRTTAGCTLDAFGLPDPATCQRVQFMYAYGPSSEHVALHGTYPDPTPALHLVPYDTTGLAPELTAVGTPAYNANKRTGCTVDLNNRFKDIHLDGTSFVQCAPFPGTESTLEYFGNIPVVNGVVNGQYNLEAGRVHRMRFIGGTDSRTWVLQLVQTAGAACGSTITCDATMPDGLNYKNYTAAAVIPFWQIGSEQGFLNAPVKRDFIDLMSGERVDVLVDLTNVPAGTTVMLKNLGEDAPYPGIYSLGTAPSSVTIPEVMKFNVVTPAVGAPATSTRPSLDGTTVNTAMVLRPANIQVPTVTPGVPVKNLALIEITDQYGNTMPTIDARGYIVPGMHKTEYMLRGTTEQWDIINTTVDAHPMHPHQMAHIVLARETVNSFTPPESNNNTMVYSQSSYTSTPAAAAPMDPNMVNGVSAWDKGWKDTVQSIPGMVQKIVGTWDFAGEYVWHCHILSHEEHDMMRPSQIVTASSVKPPEWLGAQANNGQGSIKLWWPAVSGATGYIIHESQTGDFTDARYAATTGPVTSAVLKLKADGSYRYRIAAIMPAVDATDHPKQTAFRTMANTVSLNKTVVAPAWVGSSAIPGQNLVKVWWAASTTPNTFASTEGSLYYPLDYLVTYDVTATLTVAPFTAYTTTGITGTTNNISATIGAGVDPVTGATLPLPNGTYSFSVVASKASYKPSAVISAAAPVTLNVTNVAPAYLGAAKANATSVKLWWPTVAGQVVQIMDGAANVTPASILTSGNLSYVILTGVAAGPHTYTIQNLAQPGITNPSAIVTSATVTL